MGHTTLIGIKLPYNVNKKIFDLRKKINFNYTLGQYPNHEPHITLYINSFNNINFIEKKLIKLIDTVPSFDIKLEGINSFESDPITKESILILKVKKGITNLKNLQKKIIKSVHSFRNQEYSNWLFSQNNTLNKEKKENIINTGTPINLEEYDFHATICSIPQKELTKIKKDIGKITFEFQVKKLSVFIIKNDKFVFWKDYSLK